MAGSVCPHSLLRVMPRNPPDSRVMWRNRRGTIRGSPGRKGGRLRMVTPSPESSTAPVTQRWATTVLEAFYQQESANSPVASRRLEWRPLKVPSTSPWVTMCGDTGFFSTRSLHAGAELQAGLRYGAGLAARPGEALGGFPALTLQLPAVCLLQ